MHLFGRDRDHDYYSNSSVKRSRTPNQFLGVGLHTIAMSGLSRVRTELAPLRIIPSLAHHPVQTNRQLAGPCDLGGFPSSPHHQVKIFAAPLGHTAHRHLRRAFFLVDRARCPLALRESRARAQAECRWRLRRAPRSWNETVPEPPVPQATAIAFGSSPLD
jgi:hypothetical protein